MKIKRSTSKQFLKCCQNFIRPNWEWKISNFENKYLICTFQHFFHFISFPASRRKKNWNLKSKSISESDWSERFDADIAPPSQNLFIPEFYYYFLFLNFFCYFFIRIESVKSAEEWICREYLPTPFFKFQQTVSNQISTFIFSFFSEIFLIHALPSFEKFNKAKKQKQKSKKKDSGRHFRHFEISEYKKGGIDLSRNLSH